LRFDFYNVVLNSATTALVRKGARRLRPSSLRIGGRFHREPGARWRTAGARTHRAPREAGSSTWTRCRSRPR